MSQGTLRVQLYVANGAFPISGAVVTVSKVLGGILQYQRKTTADSDGRTGLFYITTPSRELSLEENNTEIPYETVEVKVEAPGYETALISGIQVFSGQESLMQVEMLPLSPADSPATQKDSVLIPPHHLTEKNRGIYLPKESGDNFILDRAYIPDQITVHLGAPKDNARNVRVPFIDYIKNVASSEIYPTWPESSLRANIYAQISLALNRIYTEWYRSRSYDFDITGSPSYDQAYVYGRNIFDNISKLVDDIFNTFIRKRMREEPYFAEYCDGKTVTCPGMSQWGTVSLAQQGFTPLQILQQYYGNDVLLTTTNLINGIPESYPGEPLRRGSSGRNVSNLQIQLNRIGRNYPNIPLIFPVDGSFGAETEQAVKAFQTIFNLTADGVVGKSTWYKISYIYASVKKLAELTSEGEQIEYEPGEYPGYALSEGSEGLPVAELQHYLGVISAFFDAVPFVNADGVFGSATKSAVIAFQQLFSLSADGVVGRRTWNKIYEEYLAIQGSIPLPSENAPYPGTPLRQGSRGNSVKRMQIYLDGLRSRFPSLPELKADGIFGSTTAQAVRTFQRLNGLQADGIIGRNTWNAVSRAFDQLQG